MTPSQPQKSAEEIAAEIVVSITDELPVLTSNRKRLLHKELTLKLQSYGEQERNKALDEAIEIAGRPWDYCPTEYGYEKIYKTAMEIAEDLQALKTREGLLP